MKQVFTLLFLLISAASFAQKNTSRIVLSKGQKFVVKDTLTQEVDMSMGMTMKNSGTLQNNFVILDATDKNYIGSKTLTGVKVSMDMMGQSVNYDSDKKEDSASELGKSIKTLNVPDTFMLDKNTGALTFGKKEVAAPSDNTNPFENMFQSMGNSSDPETQPFLVVPAGIKQGGSWIDSSSTADMKQSKKYTVKSIDKNIATITIEGDIQRNLKPEMQGMQMTIVMNTKITGDIILDTKTSLIKRKATTSDISGTLEMMGQSIPVTGKGTSISVYEY